MSQFEVFIPAKDESGINVTLTVDAPNWIGALKTGLSNIGEGQEAISNVMCDIKEDNSIHVTNPNTGRVFRLKELGGEAPVYQEAEVVTETATPPDPAPMSGPSAPAPAAADTIQEMPAVEPAPAPAAAPARARGAPPPKRATGQFQAAPQAANRQESKPAPTDPKVGRADIPPISVDEVIADVFDATQDLQLDGTIDPGQVAATLLDLALQNVPAESGTFYLADINGSALTFEAVRGPKADEIKKKGLQVAVGQGIVGFCAQEGVCLVISDMQHDRRYFSRIADAVGYAPKDTLCASAEKDGRLFGAIQLINSKRGAFTQAEMEIVRYIGLTAADMLERAAEQAS